MFIFSVCDPVLGDNDVVVSLICVNNGMKIVFFVGNCNIQFLINFIS